MNDEREEIRQVAHILLEAHKHGWTFITLDEFSRATELSKDRVLEILNLFKKAGIYNYDFLPFDDPSFAKQDIFNKNAEIQNPKGAIALFPVKDFENLTPEKIKRFHSHIKLDALRQLISSDAGFEVFTKKISYFLTVDYDDRTLTLHYKGKSVKISSGNERIICKTLFSKPLGTRFAEADIANNFEHNEKYANGVSTQTIYNAKNAINIKFEKQTRIKGLIELRDGQMWAEIRL